MTGLTERLERQAAVLEWVERTFGHDVAWHPGERLARFVEEALELAQACGMEQSDVQSLAAHVYAKPPGRIEREFGGVGITLLGLAAVYGVHADECEAAELERVLAIDPSTFVTRHNAKAKAGIARWATTQEPRG